MSRPLKMENRKSRPQCRFEVDSVERLQLIKDQAERYGYPDFTAFALALFSAVAKAAPASGMIRFGHRYGAMRTARRKAA